MNQPITPEKTDRILFRADLMTELKVGSEAVRRWLKSGKLPKPDIYLSRRTLGWRLSTLNKAGINLP